MCEHTKIGLDSYTNKHKLTLSILSPHLTSHLSSRSCAVPLLQVFYPGGYNPNPVGWRGRSLMAIGGICLTMVPIFVWSAKNESRPLPPTHWIPSQLWYVVVTGKLERLRGATNVRVTHNNTHKYRQQVRLLRKQGDWRAVHAKEVEAE